MNLWLFRQTVKSFFSDVTITLVSLGLRNVFNFFRPVNFVLRASVLDSLSLKDHIFIVFFHLFMTFRAYLSLLISVKIPM